MKTAIFSYHKFEEPFFEKANLGKHDLLVSEDRLTESSISFAEGCKAVSLFVNDDGSATILDKLKSLGVGYIALRSAGFNNVNLQKAKELGIRVARVPSYSPYAVAEHAITLILSLNRNIIRAHNRVSELNFSLDGLTGFDLKGKTVGIIGTGKIGSVTATIFSGFGCYLLGYDIVENEELTRKVSIQYTSLHDLFTQSDIITLHCPLNENTRYIINQSSIELMKRNVMLINTSRGGLINTRDVIQALKSGQIGYFGMDVYEEEEHLFFQDHSGEILQDEIIARLLSFRNVLITGHQAFLTQEALTEIARTTVYNLDCFQKNIPCDNELFL